MKSNTEPKYTTNNNKNDGQSNLLCGPRPAAIGGKERHWHDADLARVMSSRHRLKMARCSDDDGIEEHPSTCMGNEGWNPTTEAHQIVIATVEGSNERVRLATAPLAYVGSEPRLQ